MILVVRLIPGLFRNREDAWMSCHEPRKDSAREVSSVLDFSLEIRIARS
jgi:hypothetical protein